MEKREREKMERVREELHLEEQAEAARQQEIVRTLLQCLLLHLTLLDTHCVFLQRRHRLILCRVARSKKKQRNSIPKLTQKNPPKSNENAVCLFFLDNFS